MACHDHSATVSSQQNVTLFIGFAVTEIRSFITFRLHATAGLVATPVAMLGLFQFSSFDFLRKHWHCFQNYNQTFCSFAWSVFRIILTALQTIK
jgi:hypothetical protein